jgi:predicted acetyltransferase
LVPDSTFFCLDEERNIIVGAVNIRHHLNESLLLNGGHIGDGVRPSERRKGIATKMIALALNECKKLGIERVLMVCDKENVGSAKSIQNNGGILENEIDVDGVVEQRYWIELV